MTMKTYEKYLLEEKYIIPEGITASKALSKVKDTIKGAKTPIEVRLVKTMIVNFIKKFKSEYTDAVSKEIDSLLKDAEKRVS